MVQVIYVDHKGVRREISAEPGMNAMEVAVKNGVDAILGECGGACACATCQVYVAPEWFDKLPEASQMEIDMLDFATDPRPNSRLACQITLTEALDGLVLETPEDQG